MALGFFKKLFNGIKKVGSTIYNKAIKPIYNAVAPMVKTVAPAIGTAIGTYLAPGSGSAIGGTAGGIIVGLWPDRFS
jgi:hypothetical protein